MKDTSKSYFIIGLIAAAALLLLWLFVSLIFSMIGTIIVAVSAYFIIKHFSDDKGADGDSTDDKQASLTAEEIGIESVLESNLLLRKSIVPIQLRDSFEQVIDQLLDILPKVNELDADGELAWVINRMATVYLPNKSIQPYLALNEEARKDESTIASVEEGLAGMKSELLEVEQILATRKTNEFKTKAKFLKQRFND